MMRTKRGLAAAALLASLAAAPALAAPPQGAPASLVDDSFALPADAQLVSTQPISDAPAVPSGATMPDNEMTIVWVLLGVLGGATVGFFAGLACCFVYYWY